MAERFAEKGVIDILSSKFKLGRMQQEEDMIEMASALVGIHIPKRGTYILTGCGAVKLIPPKVSQDLNLE